MAGKHTDAHGKGVEEELHPRQSRQPEHQGRPHHRAPQRLYQQGEQEYHYIRQQQHRQPRGVMADKEPLPPDGQCAHEVGRPGGIQVAAHRHGRQQAIDHRKGQGRIPTQAVHRRGKRQEPIPAVFQLPLQGHHPLGGQGQHPEHQAYRPDGPEAEDRLFPHCYVKERCPGPHSPHLPFHK